ncbi:GntR family transcriptional regulator [Sphingosinicella microcystinivorans]|uniref:DNA-binding GntR family transcriptional regulator n=1 Tax=Sphingosinicella microcystinivorans TaxID=335406 RepID=A0AAD1D286_SPHMI|nr:GntR family transcriptional regulator [Sphingosinicella microcystinivorans]RKS88653.1 DNA-binding GntR family transcriptional regulator [Sphingosinicella microcystinivorans]BBE32400.1 hypothetical protein SmB9_00580 [Sphingosinicella microcystinivorans]
MQDRSRHLVYSRIRAGLEAGMLAAGSTLRVPELAGHFRVSHTPVREALAGLHGERLLTLEHRQGYRVPWPRPAELSALYQCSGLLVTGAISRGDTEDVRQALLLLPEPQDVRLVMRACIAPLENEVLLAMFDTVCARLALARRAEAALFDIAAEAAALAAACAAGRPALLRAMRAHHDKRIHSAGTLSRPDRTADATADHAIISPISYRYRLSVGGASGVMVPAISS